MRQLLTVKEYAELRGKSVQTVYKQIRRHHKEVKNYLRKKNGATCITARGVEILDGFKPTKQTEIIATTPSLESELEETRQKLQDLQEKVIAVYAEKDAIQKQLMELTAEKLQLLEDKTNQATTIATQAQRITDLESELSNKKSRGIISWFKSLI